MFLALSLHAIFKPILTIYAPMIYTAPCVMFFMRARTLRGGALEIETFLGPERARADRRVPFGAQKSQDFQGTTPS